MSATKESIDKSKAACQSPHNSPLLVAAKLDVRPLSPLTIGGTTTIVWKTPAGSSPKKPVELPKIDLQFIDGAPPAQGYSYNCMDGDPSRARHKK